MGVCGASTEPTKAVMTFPIVKVETHAGGAAGVTLLRTLCCSELLVANTCLDNSFVDTSFTHDRGEISCDASVFSTDITVPRVILLLSLLDLPCILVATVGRAV